MISEQYRKQQENLHKNPNYGVASIGFAPLVTDIINSMGIKELLDYGAGKGRLALHIEPINDLMVDHYDPAIPEWSDRPEPKQMVACIDVLEHIEPDFLDDVLDELQRLTKEIGFFTIHTGAAMKFLDDGRNAHLIQEDERWWLPRLWSRFDLIIYNKSDNGFYVIVRPKCH